MRAVMLVLMAFASYNVADAFLKHIASLYYFAEAAFYPSLFYGVFVLLAHKRFGGASSLLKTNKKALHLLRAMAGTGCYLCFVIALKNITLAEAYTILLSSPFWIATLSIFFFQEKIGWHRWLAIVIGFIGVLVVLRPGVIAVQPASLLMLGAALCFSFFVIFTRKIGSEESLFNMVIIPIIMEAIVFIPLIILNGNWQPPQAGHIIFFIAAGLFYLGGTSLSALGFSAGESSLLAPLHYSQIIWGSLIGYFIFQEIPEKWTILGAAIIIGSGIYLIYREHINHKTTVSD